MIDKNRWNKLVRDAALYVRQIWLDTYYSLKSLRQALLWAVVSFGVGDILNYYESGRSLASKIDYETWISSLRPAVCMFFSVLIVRIIFVAPFRLWRRDQEEKQQLYARIQPSLRVTTGTSEPWIQVQCGQQPGQTVVSPGYLYTYRIGVSNGGVEPVRNVRVRLVEIEPAPVRLIPMPCHLEIMNDRQEPRRESFDLQPSARGSDRDGVFVDVVRYFVGDSSQEWMGFCHLATGVNTSVHSQRYRLKLTISSDNGGDTIEHWFCFDPSRDAKDRFQVDEGE